MGKKITVIVIPANETQPARLEEIERDDVREFQQLVDGHLQVIAIRNPDAGIYLNEDGKGLTLPLNRRATRLLWVHNSDFRERDSIVGDCFIVGVPDRHGNDRSAPAELQQLIFNAEAYRIDTMLDDAEEWSSANVHVVASWEVAYQDALHIALTNHRVREVRLVAIR